MRRMCEGYPYIWLKNIVLASLYLCNAHCVPPSTPHAYINRAAISKHYTQRPPSVNFSNTDLWKDLRKHLILNHYPQKPTVKKQIDRLLQRPQQLCDTLERSAPYIQFIYTHVKKRHLPAELVFLPFVESTYNPFALNKSSKSSGLWQLMSKTAHNFGVRQDHIFDGKRDIYMSTNAALDYLTYLNQLFSGDWLLALAAYTTGEGNVKRAMRYNRSRYRSTTVWHLPLALEAVSYVPKLLAISEIIKNPAKYKLKLPTVYSRPYLLPVQVTKPISIAQAAILANMTLKDMHRFNPGFQQLHRIPTHSYQLLLPREHVLGFKRNLSRTTAKNINRRAFQYTVKRNDSLGGIAKQQGVKLSDLCRWNGMSKGQKLRVNQRLTIAKKASFEAF